MRVLLIDDHALFRVGLEGLLERRGIEVAQAGDGQDGLHLAASLNPDVILLDLRMPEMSGLEILKQLHKQEPATPIVMLTTSDDENDLVHALRQGAAGYLLKDMDPDELVVALRDIMAGEMVVAPGLAAVLANVIKAGDSNESETSPFASLTPREFEILCHLAEGQSNKAIARDLDISDGTVKLHVKAILRKLGVHSRIEAAVMAVEHGVCPRSGR